MTDADLVRAVEDLTLPLAEWTHRAHVRVAFAYLRRLPFDDALTKMRATIKAYNTRNSVPESPTSGYHETTTRAMTHLVAATMAAYDATHPTPDSDSFCDAHPQLMTRHVLRLFYSPQQRMRPEGKTQFVGPDLTPLPRIGRSGSGAEPRAAPTPAPPQ